MTRTLPKAIAILLLMAAMLECYWRGPLHQKKWRLWDYGSIYASARAMLQGTNPYDTKNCAAVWREAGGAAAWGVPFNEVQVPIVPPSTYAVLEPTALVGARWAMRLWMYGELVMIFGVIGLLATLAGWRWCDWQPVLLAIGVLGFAPIHYSWVSGQTSIPVLFIATLSLCCVAEKKDWAAGVLLGVAIAIKPPLVAPLVVCYFLIGRPRAAVAAVVIAMLILGIGILQLQFHHIPWLQDWHRNVQTTSAPGTINDFSGTNPDRYDLVCLQLLISQVVENRAAVNGLAIGITGILCLLYLAAFLRSECRQNLLLTAGAAVALGLLPFYHRCTDAVVLLLPLAWVISQITHLKNQSLLNRALPWIALVLAMSFLLPEETGHKLATRYHYQFLPLSVWDLMVIPLHVWALLLLCITLIAAMAVADQPARSSGR